jgi:hypothetical protein
MSLTRGRALGYDAVRMVFRFTMTDEKSKVIHFEISSSALDELSGRRGTMPDERESQFLNLRAKIEETAFELHNPKSADEITCIYYHNVRKSGK